MIHRQRTIHCIAQELVEARLFVSLLLSLVLLAAISCGGGQSNSATATGPLQGNWEITVVRHGATMPLVYTGFLMQTAGAVRGSVILGDGCSGVGSVNGSVDSQNLTLSIHEFGQDLSLTGSLPSGGGPVTGQFTTLGGACSGSSTGIWSAVQVASLAGGFHGTFTSLNGTLDVTGTLTQGPNIGASTASVSGNITATGTAICTYLTTATINGVISGSVLNLNLYDSNGNLIGQIPTTSQPAILTPDGTSLSGSYSLSQKSGSCAGDNGAFQLNFP